MDFQLDTDVIHGIYEEIRPGIVCRNVHTLPGRYTWCIDHTAKELEPPRDQLSLVLKTRDVTPDPCEFAEAVWTIAKTVATIRRYGVQAYLDALYGKGS